MDTLQQYRNMIDEIDSTILELLRKRSDVVLSVKKIKDTNKTQDFLLYIKPKREFLVLQNILNNTQDLLYSQKFVYNMWRGIIVASNFLEQNLQLLALCENSCVDLYQYFGMQKVPDVCVDAEVAIQNIMENRYSILAFNAKSVAIWDLLKTQSQIKVFAVAGESNNLTLICGKIALDDFTIPALSITLEKTDRILNQNSGIYISNDCIINENTLGCFYPHPLQEFK